MHITSRDVYSMLQKRERDKAILEYDVRCKSNILLLLLSTGHSKRERERVIYSDDRNLMMMVVHLIVAVVVAVGWGNVLVVIVRVRVYLQTWIDIIIKDPGTFP